MTGQFKTCVNKAESSVIGQRIPGHTDQLNCFIDLKNSEKQE